MATNIAPSFAIGDGKVLTTVGVETSEGHSITQQADGRIVVAGYSHNSTDTNNKTDFTVVRYNADGSLDTTFDSDGKVITDFGGNDYAWDVVVQPDGKILAVGFTSIGLQTDHDVYDLAIVRYNADGSLDASFDGDGKLTTTTAGEYGNYDVALQPDGKILVATSDFSNGSFDFALLRYNANGTLDSTFDGDGKVKTDFFLGDDRATSIALQPDGKILVAGHTTNPSNNGRFDFAVARYNANGSLDTTFDGDGKLVTALGTGDDFATSIAVQADGKILVGGYGFVTPNSGNDFIVVRYNPNGSLDTTFDGDGKVTKDPVSGNSQSYSISVQSDGKIVVGGDTTNSSQQDLATVRYTTSGSLDSTFDGDGVAVVDLRSADLARDMALQADGRILLTGYSFTPGTGGGISVARQNPNGSIDPTFNSKNTLDGAPTYTGNGPAVVLDTNVRIYDADLAAQGHYAGATLTLARHGGASAQDVYSASGGLGGLSQGSALIYSSVTVGTVTTNSGGTLVLTFNANATQARVDGVLEAIAYSNTGGAPSAVQIDWTFSDGNSGAQGTGGALAATGSTTVTILPGGRALTDLNSDHHSDILWRSPGGEVAAWVMNGAQILQAKSLDVLAAPWTVIDTRGDFNADGKTDLLWRNTTSGEVAYWRTDGAQVSQAKSLGLLPASWSIVDGHGDYDRDGTSDVLWRNTGSGEVAWWRIVDGQQVAAASIGVLPTSWSIIQGHGDYIGDGATDILWRNTSGEVAYWRLEGTQLTQAKSLGVLDPSWTLVDGRGDYNGDGINDILWRSPGGEVALWRINAGEVTAAASIGSLPTSWHIIDAHGDYNGDRISDVLWRHDNGEVALWQLQERTITVATSLGSLPADWVLVDGHADYDGNLTSDILWRSPGGEAVAWLMGGSQILQAKSLGVMPANWSVVDGAELAASLNGDSSGNTLQGTVGRDQLRGGPGADSLTGGAGGDRFIFQSSAELGTTDVITDFSKLGGDVLELRELLQQFGGYNAGNAFSGGYLDLAPSGADTLVRVDSNGGGDSFVTLAVIANVLLTPSDTSNLLL